MKLILLLIITIFNIFSSTYSSNISFFDSMQTSTCFDRNFAATNENWMLLKKLYDVNLCFKSAIYKIPKKIHHIWIGPKRLPEESKPLIETWKKFHPDWEHKLWSNEDIKNFPLKNRKAFDAASNWGEKSDILRYEILYNYGGLYVDHDCECLKPFDDFNKCCSFYSGISYSKGVQIANTIIGASAGHPLLKICIDNIKEKAPNDNEIILTLCRTGPYYFTKCFLEHARKKPFDIVAFPVSYFFPWPTENIEKSETESYAIHYWAGTWYK